MKVYIMTDLEGVAGVVDWEKRLDQSPQNMEKRKRYGRLLTEEVNAAVEGCLDAGAEDILVEDAHGGGYTVDFENLHPRARIYHGWNRPRIMAPMDASFDAMIMIGAHAMARTKGAVLYHTMSTETKELRLNGKAVGEFGIFAFVAGAFNVPTVMVSGDTAACKEAKKLIPGITAVEVKKGFSRYSALSLSAEVSRAAISEGVAESLRKKDTVKPFKLKSPFFYQEVIFEGEKAGTLPSHPDDLPGKFRVYPPVKARTEVELINKVWGRKV